MITIKYIPNLNEIVGFVNKNECYSLKNLEQIEKPKIMFDVIPFMKKRQTSNWIELPYNESVEFTKKVFGLTLPKLILINKVDFSIEYTHNEVGESFMRISAKLPKPVLNNLCQLFRKFYLDKTCKAK